jgi:hypothetical protein
MIVTPDYVEERVCAHGLFSQASEARGEDAILVSNALLDVQGEMDRSIFWAGSAQTALAELANLKAKAATDDWDGEGGSRIAPASLSLAVKLLRSMPRGWPAPSVSLDADGEVDFEWFAGPTRRLSLSVGKTGKLSYAWLNSTAEGAIEQNYGVAKSEGSFPETISDVISQFNID